MATRDKWSSRFTFILAAVGSAVGLGNAWRFPYLAARYGGGAFLLVYVFAMIIMGLPLLMMELGIGRRMQRGSAGTFRGINKKSEWVGWAGVGNAFAICSYYAVILGWILIMIVKSFTFGGLTGQPDAAGAIFNDSVLKLIPSVTGSASYDIPGAIMLAIVIAWVLMYLCIRKGTKSVDKVITVLIGIPMILLVVLAIRGFTLPHAIEGLKKLFIPDWNIFADEKLGPMIWVDAFSQVFYSMSIMMAIMIAYGSYLSKSANVISDAIIIGFSDLAASIIVSIVMFTTLAGTGLLPELKTIAGPSLAFKVYPMAIVNFTKVGAINVIFGIIFYLTLFTLALDSAFSIVEGVSSAISDKLNVKKSVTTLAICCIAGLISIIYCTKAGLLWLDIVDYFCNNVNLLLIGILECLVVGWFFKTEKLRQELNRTASKFKLGVWYDWIIKVIAPLILAALFILNIINYAKAGGYGGYPWWALLVGGWIPSALVFFGGFIIKFIVKKSPKLQEHESNEPMWDDMDNISEDHEQYDEQKEESLVEATTDIVKK